MNSTYSPKKWLYISLTFLVLAVLYSDYMARHKACFQDSGFLSDAKK